jgi:hypothetical protein
MTGRQRRHRHLLRIEDDDPLAFVANLFDVAMVFAVALLFAYSAANSARTEPIDPNRVVDRLVETGRSTTGEGQRVGTAYRLTDGRIIYVPE